MLKATAEVVVVRGAVNKRKLITEQSGGPQTTCETQTETDGKRPCSRARGEEKENIWKRATQERNMQTNMRLNK